MTHLSIWRLHSFTSDENKNYSREIEERIILFHQTGSLLLHRINQKFSLEKQVDMLNSLTVYIVSSIQLNYSERNLVWNENLNEEIIRSTR